MIQRIQTIYYALAMTLMAFSIFLPVCRFIGDNGQVYLLHTWGIVEAGREAPPVVIHTIPLLILFLVILFLLLIAVFSFRKRMLQMRLSVFTMVLMVGSLALLYFYRKQGMMHLNADAYFTLYAALPIVSAILTYLAFRGVKKDEELIRSYDRIR
jgi:hypothetical protein